MSPLLSITLVMLVAGSVGGLVNSFLLDSTDETKMAWWKHCITGIAASFMVPLFLNITSGNLIDKIIKGSATTPPDEGSLFVLGGFCLIAAVSSRAFIRSLTQRVLEEAKSATKKANEAKDDAAEAKAAVEPFIEPEAIPDSEEISDDLSALIRSNEPVTNANEIAVLKAMVSGPYSLRSITGIAKDSGLDKEVVNSTLSTLIGKNLVSQGVSNKGQPRWMPTPSGRALIPYIERS